MFSKGTVTSTMTTVLDGSCDKKYVIFVDMEGAFDNLWWPTILARLVRAKCNIHLKVVKSYFKNRKVIVQNKMKTYARKMQKGCPQGSIIRPAAWLWSMDVVLNDLRENVPPECAEFIAYADDLACVLRIIRDRNYTSIPKK